MLRLSRASCALRAAAYRRSPPGFLPTVSQLRFQSSAPAAALAAAASPADAAVTAAAAAPGLLDTAHIVVSNSLPNLALAGPSFLDSGFPTSSPLLWVQYGLMKGIEGLHTGIGLEWWGAVAAASVGLRVATFLLCFVRSTRMGAWMQHHSEALASYTDRLTAARAAGDKEGANATVKEYYAFMAAKDLHLGKNIALPAVAQLVIFASFFTGLRKLAEEAHLVGGLAGPQAVAGTWLTALHLPDPTFTLPIVSGLLTVASIAANPNMAGVPQAELTPGGQKVVFGTMASVFNLAACTFPSSVQLYLAITSGTMLVQQGLLRLAPVKAFFNFPSDWPLSAEALAERAAKRGGGKAAANPLVDGMKEFAPIFRVASDLAEGKVRSRPKHTYLGFMGLRDPGVPPPPVAPNTGAK